jgi:serine/threonine protein kinase
MLKGRYRVDQVLHIGARSTVYAGVDQKSGRVAIKVLDGTLDESLLRSSYLANAVGHPSAVNVLDAGSTGDGAIFLVMELIEATSMRELMSQHEGHLPVRLACNIADQGLDLLASAHDQGITHGEIALDKLFFMRTERLKVLGFGKPASGQAAADDVRALSKAIAWLLCGEPVESVQTTPASSAIQPRLPARIASVIERGLTSDPALHWKSAHAMRTALQLACKAELGRPIDRSLQPVAAKNMRRRPSRRAWLAGAAALVIGLYISREVTEIGQAEVPEADAQTDITTALQPPQAQAKEAAATAAQAEEQPASVTSPPGPPEQSSLPEPEPSPAPRAARKPNRPGLRTPIKRSAGTTTNIAPTNQLCAQLSSARRARPLSDHEAQLYLTRCSSKH